MKKSIPNFLTSLRILVIPALIGAFYIKGEFGYLLASSLFLFASITDFLDGYMARIWKAQSKLGRFMDPIADKLLIATALLLLVNGDRAPILPTIAIVCREMLVSGLREFLAELNIGVPVSKLAKIKTSVQMAAIYLLLLDLGGPDYLHSAMLGKILLWVAAILTLITGYAYFKTGWKHMWEEETPN